MRTHFKQIFLEKEEIEKKCIELAKWVDETYEKSKKELVLVGLLKGSVPFLAQLIKNIKVVHSIDFMVVSSFKGGIKRKGTPKIIMDLNQDIKDKNILIVEDILDSGHTLNEIKKVLMQRNPNSLKIITLLKKKNKKPEIFVDKCGFEVPDVFLAGFGLDVNEKLRNLDFIGEFDITKIPKY